MFPPLATCYSSVCLPSLVLDRPNCSTLRGCEEPTPDEGQPGPDHGSLRAQHEGGGESGTVRALIPAGVDVEEIEENFRK